MTWWLGDFVEWLLWWGWPHQNGFGCFDLIPHILHSPTGIKWSLCHRVSESFTICDLIHIWSKFILKIFCCMRTLHLFAKSYRWPSDPPPHRDASNLLQWILAMAVTMLRKLSKNQAISTPFSKVIQMSIGSRAPSRRLKSSFDKVIEMTIGSTPPSGWVKPGDK